MALALALTLTGCHDSGRTAGTTTTTVAADPAKVAHLEAGIGAMPVLPRQQQSCLVQRLAAGLSDPGVSTLSTPSPPLAKLDATDAAVFDRVVKACVVKATLTASIAGGLHASKIATDGADCIAGKVADRHRVVELYRLVLGADASPSGPLSDEMYRAAVSCKVILPGSGL